jgi:hypothetical protein
VMQFLAGSWLYPIWSNNYKISEGVFYLGS